jgi:hypothetical protein
MLPLVGKNLIQSEWPALRMEVRWVKAPVAAPRWGQVEQLVHTEIRISTPKFPHGDLLGPPGLGGRLSSFQRRTQPPANGSKELRRGVANRGDPAPGQDNCAGDLGAQFDLLAAPRASHCSEVVGLAPGGSVG